ncbi:MAG: Acetoacetate decarboxylase [Ilumatobacteraceae bacterium]|jgi:hypothetical protein|nr:Acetoacetate decarboxylase [Ilumatobacteraceae bacterium]
MTAPVLDAPADAALVLAGAEVFQATFEHAGSRGDEFFPAGLAATSPVLVTFLVLRVPESPHGPFTIAQVRLSCRSGVRARALVVATAVDAAEATTAWLAAGWGIGGAPPVRVERRYDRVRVGSPWFDVELTGPKPVGTESVQYVTGLHPVAVPSGARLAQFEVEVVPDRVERGRPVLHRFVAPEAAPGLVPASAVVATFAVGTLTLPRVRFLLRPDQPAHLGTERL